MILASEEDAEGEAEPTSQGEVEKEHKRDTMGIIRQSIRFQNDRLSSNILNDLDIDKISELKHIYSICEGNRGYANLDQIAECKKIFFGLWDGIINGNSYWQFQAIIFKSTSLAQNLQLCQGSQ